MFAILKVTILSKRKRHDFREDSSLRIKQDRFKHIKITVV